MLVQYIAAMFVFFLSFMYKVGGRIVGEADLVSSALSFHLQCTSNCGFILYIARVLCALFCVSSNNKY